MCGRRETIKKYFLKKGESFSISFFVSVRGLRDTQGVTLTGASSPTITSHTLPPSTAPPSAHAGQMLVQLLTTALLATVHAAVPADLVTSLPGYGAPPTDWYSGYVSFNSVNGARLHMHYVLQLSPNASSDPLTLWYNGGVSFPSSRFSTTFPCSPQILPPLHLPLSAWLQQPGGHDAGDGPAVG